MLSHVFSPPKHQAPSTKQVANTKKEKKKEENGEEALKQRDSLYVFFWINFLTIQTRGTGEAAAEAETMRERDWRMECAAVCERESESESEKCGYVGYVG